MPATSKAQYRYIQSIRSKYGSREKTPEKDQWVWDGEWTEGVDYKSLPAAASEKAAAAVLKWMRG